MRQPSGRAATLAGSNLFRSLALILANMGVLAVSAYAFWWLAARTAGQGSVGLASAATSACLLLSNLASLGLGNAIIFARRDLGGRMAGVASASLLSTSAVSVGCSTVFIAGLPLWSPGLEELADPQG